MLCSLPGVGEKLAIQNVLEKFGTPHYEATRVHLLLNYPKVNGLGSARAKKD